jgi:hypothetical protein
MGTRNDSCSLNDRRDTAVTDRRVVLSLQLFDRLRRCGHQRDMDNGVIRIDSANLSGIRPIMVDEVMVM